MDKKKQVVIAGTGPGSGELMTLQVRQAVESADVLIGAARMTAAFSDTGRMIINEYRAPEIAEAVRNTDAESFAVLVSGDPGLFSAAPAVYRALQEYRPRILPGISSVIYLCSALGLSWEEAVMISGHGRKVNIASEVRRSRLTCVLTDRNTGSLLRTLTEYGLGHVKVYIGQDLTYPDEKIYSGTAEELSASEYDPPAVLLVINENAGPLTYSGLADESFIRSRVPMTKRPVRAVTMSMLAPEKDSIVYDIGAGTGSVSVEAAHAAWRGTVYAVEHEPEAIGLIRQNARLHSADNIEIIEGRAPQVLKGLPAPDRVFIGGSGGSLGEILDALAEISAAESKSLRLVMNAVSMETIAEAVVMLGEKGFTDVEYTQISAAVSRLAGRHHLMKADNPVFIIKAELRTEADQA